MILRSPKADVLVACRARVREGSAHRESDSADRDDSRTAAHFTVKCDGAPDFQPVTDTTLRHAVNSLTPVIVTTSGSYYACQTAAWFTSSSPNGPWTVATTVPVDIYTIPPSSPLHYVTYVKVYGYPPTSVYVGYTPGYSGTVLSSDGVVVYGTGYSYPSYIGSTLWVPSPYTYGVGAAFSWSAAAGWALGFGLGFTAGALSPWWGPVGYWGWGAVAPAWGWGATVVLRRRISTDGHWGERRHTPARERRANPALTGNIVMAPANAAPFSANPVTGTSGVARRGGDFNARLPTATMRQDERARRHTSTTGVS
jgi:hypothetical protein